MAEEIRLNTAELGEKAASLRAGQRVLLSGTCYTCLSYTSDAADD